MTVQVAVFGRAPVAGRTKTRLAKALGPEGAASLYAAFLEDVLTTAHALPRANVRFWCADAEPSAVLDALLQNRTPRTLQRPGTLGDRMYHALREGVATHDACLLIGSDAPTLPRTYLELGRQALANADVVLGVCADGGYYLVGTRRVAAQMFEEVRWSTRFALTDTERACQKTGLRIARLPCWYDVDRPEDLPLLRAHLTLRPGAAPATARWLQEQGDGPA